MEHKGYVYGSILIGLIALLMAANLFLGSVDIPAQAVIDILLGKDTARETWNFIVWESRFPQCITALLCGAALSASGLMLQTVFNNPLADTSILGISSGASLGGHFGLAGRRRKCGCRKLYAVGLFFCRGRRFCGCNSGAGTYFISFYTDKKLGYVTDSGYHDWLCSFFSHFVIELFCFGRRSSSRLLSGV